MKSTLVSVFGACLIGAVVVANVGAAGASVEGKTQGLVLDPVQATLSPVAAEQLKALGPGSQLVECGPGVARLPPGLTPSRGMSFMRAHPGFAVLSDGHCAMDTTKAGQDTKRVSVDP
jgi:hypothetical protein